MPEEVNSKALAASSTANRLEFHRRPEGKTRSQRRRMHHNGCLSTAADAAFVVGLRGPLIEVSGYDLGQNYRKMSPHLLAQHLRLAQNDKRKSEHDGRRDHGSELGKYRPESARSELQRLASCSPTKIFHVGLHAATSCWAPQQTPAQRW